MVQEPGWEYPGSAPLLLRYTGSSDHRESGPHFTSHPKDGALDRTDHMLHTAIPQHHTGPPTPLPAPTRPPSTDGQTSPRVPSRLTTVTYIQLLPQLPHVTYSYYLNYHMLHTAIPTHMLHTATSTPHVTYSYYLNYHMLHTATTSTTTCYIQLYLNYHMLHTAIPQLPHVTYSYTSTTTCYIQLPSTTTCYIQLPQLPHVTYSYYLNYHMLHTAIPQLPHVT